MSNVLVIFQADTEATEQLALAVGVGAVEAEGSIRLRRLAATGAAEVGHKGYGKLQAADLLWANTIVVGLESPRPRAEELDGLLSLLSGADPGELGGKQAWTFRAEGLAGDKTEAQVFVESALQVAGVVVLPVAILHFAVGQEMLEQMKEAGRMSARLNQTK
jgi:hypothetical protein